MLNHSEVKVENKRPVRIMSEGHNLEAGFGASMNHSDFTEANFTGIDFTGVRIKSANFTRAKLDTANLSGQEISEINFTEADLLLVNFSRADLYKANLRNAILTEAVLVESCLDGADITGVHIYEIRYGGWSIKGIVCENVFWEKDQEELKLYEPGDFERLFAELPRIEIRYSDQMSAVDLITLPLVVERLQEKHPRSIIRIRSVQSDTGGATVTVTVEDLSHESIDSFDQDFSSIERELIHTKEILKITIEERDFTRQIMSKIMPLIDKALSSNAQIIHFHGPVVSPEIEGQTMNTNNFNNYGQAGAFGSDPHAHHFKQEQVSIDLPKLADELVRLRDAMTGASTGTSTQREAIDAVDSAQKSAVDGDRATAIQHLKKAGAWALGVAEKLGVAAAIEALKEALKNGT